MPKKQTDWEAEARRFACALVNAMESIPDHEIQAHTGFTMRNCELLAQARADAEALIRGKRTVTVE